MRKQLATAQRELLDTGLREAGIRYAKFVQAGQPFITDIPALTRLIQTYNVTTKHRFNNSRRPKTTASTPNKDFARTCNLARLILVSCTSKDPLQNVCHVAVTDPTTWIERFHVLLRGMLFNLVDGTNRADPQAVLPAQVLLFLLNPKQWPARTGLNDFSSSSSSTSSSSSSSSTSSNSTSNSTTPTTSTTSPCVTLTQLLANTSLQGPGIFDALGEFLDDRSDTWLTSNSRKTIVTALSNATILSLRQEHGGGSSGQQQQAATEWYRNVVKTCLMRPLMAHNREMYVLLLEPLLKQQNTTTDTNQTWSGILQAACHLLYEGQITNSMDRARLASNIIMVANQPNMNVWNATTSCSSATTDHIKCLSLLIDDIPTKFLLGMNQTNSSTASSSMMDISDTESDEEDESFATSNEYKQGSNSGGGGGGGASQFAAQQEFANDPYGAGSRLLRGINMSDPLKRGIDANEKRRRTPFAAAATNDMKRQAKKLNILFSYKYTPTR